MKPAQARYHQHQLNVIEILLASPTLCRFVPPDAGKTMQALRYKEPPVPLIPLVIKQKPKNEN